MKNKYTVIPTNQFKKDLKAAKKRNLDMNQIESVIILLAEGKILEPKHNDHALKGNYLGYRECHISPNWLLVYKIQNDILVLTLSRTGFHSDLF